MRRLIFLSTSLPVFLFGAGCGSTVDIGCVQPPAVIAEAERATAYDIAAQLEQLPISGDLMIEFQDAIRVNFDRLSEPNACLFLFLKAIECYMDRGEIGEDMAREMAALVRVAWTESCGIKHAALVLTPEERQMIDQSRFAAQLQNQMRKLGFR